MSTRKIKDGKVNGEKVYFTSHAQATFMSDGRSVEEAINNIGNGGSGDITIECDSGSSYFIELDSDDLVNVYNDVRQKFAEGCKLFYSRPPGLVGAGNLPCNVQMADDDIVIYMSFNYSYCIFLNKYTLNQDGILQEEFTNVSFNGEFNSDGVQWIDFYANGQGDKFLADDGTYKEIEARNIPVVNHGTGDTSFILTPNVYHQWGIVSNLTLMLQEPEEGKYCEYMFQFASGVNPTSLTLPDTIKWVSEPSVEANKIYQCSIVNNIGVIASVKS